MSKKMTFEDFMNFAQEVHGSKYVYFKDTFINSHVKTAIECPLHGIFFQTPRKHIHNKQECKICAKIKIGLDKRLSKEDFLKRAAEVHGDLYDYGLVDFINCRTQIKIICRIHGVFKQKVHSHLSGSKCPKCANVSRNQPRSKKVGEILIKKFEKVHGDKFDYSLVIYNSMKTKIKIICKEHGVFEQTPTNHLNNKAGCPVCNSSKGEIALKKILDDEKFLFIQQKKFPECTYKRCLPFDFYLPDLNICIEFDGELHFKPVFGENSLKATLKNDEIKTYFCKNQGITLIRVPYTIKNLKKYLLATIASSERKLNQF